MSRREATALYLMAFVHLHCARPEKAMVFLEALDVLEPGQPRTLLALALAQLRSGQAAAGLQTLDRLRQLGPPSAPLQLLRVQALTALHRKTEASMAMRSFLQLRTTWVASSRSEG